VEPVDVVFFVYLTVIFLLLVRFGGPRADRVWHIAMHLAFLFMAVVILAMNIFRSSRFLLFARVWYVPFLYVFLFEEIGKMIHLIRPMFLDPWVLALEVRTFGGYPTVWLQDLATPWLTELMSLFYMTYYFLIPALGLNLYSRREWKSLRDLILTSSVTFFFCFLHYLFMPVLGPIFHSTLPFDLVSLHAGPLTILEQWLFFKGAIQGGAFPSSHVAVAVVVLYFAFRTKRYPYVFLFTVAGLAVSTVYNGYHYGVDVIYGVAVGLAFSLVCPVLNGGCRRFRQSPQDKGISPSEPESAQFDQPRVSSCS
jgi:membrane-associated phospholipid phosphatase